MYRNFIFYMIFETWCLARFFFFFFCALYKALDFPVLVWIACAANLRMGCLLELFRYGLPAWCGFPVGIRPGLPRLQSTMQWQWSSKGFHCCNFNVVMSVAYIGIYISSTALQHPLLWTTAQITSHIYR